MNLLEDIYLELPLHGLKQEHELGVTEIHNKMGIHLYRIECRRYDKS
ncbi:hypothetical protein [Alkaliphilus transvaalensis]|nr:hypothetical protein [Alkaliphilus transvaalensis]